MDIRPAMRSDFPMLANLITELGYPSLVEDIAMRMEVIAGRDDYAAFVSVEQTVVAGMIGVSVSPSFYRSGLGGAIIALVVSPDFRGQGIAVSLVAHAEQWLRERGADRVTINPSNHRLPAHRLYHRLGYENTGIRFTKAL
ncbi:GNAT family N-acetyltransferase [Agrobacterium vitis]|uniref:GNAT family N-acetyltransferase n=2 Tax=Agrobacterium vitis TaxID=373 RepID=A0ABD6GCD6_AGRVI|nr:GNAT family N-acetyltransferase [Agrobacterium vitis]MUO93349.1 GNAT family N-acetyltransferase [Agrobacterium vitis]MUP04700.1 GNAT family N-acetyltransferase [Agrobacterium vitis]MUZ80863.1 GNAT family N-acetyltransferase [Agrobacterium vitis]MVA08952.1 GNAT family N-acetyltransferase [Agrobacterium vitis]